MFLIFLFKGIFLDDRQVARVLSLFENGGKDEIVNYGIISVLPCFSKKLKKLLNYLFNYFEMNNYIQKIFRFQRSDSIGHALL